MKDELEQKIKNDLTEAVARTDTIIKNLRDEMEMEKINLRTQITEVRQSDNKEIQAASNEPRKHRNIYNSTTHTQSLNEEKDMQENYTEMREREKRKQSLVIFGIKEIEKEDKEWAYEWIKENLDEGIQKKDIFDINRIGNRNDIDRPLRIKLSSREKRNEILGKAKHEMQKLEEETGQRCYVNPDLTRKQRAQQKDLRLALKEKRKEGGNWTIKSNKLIQIEDPTTDAAAAEKPKEI